MGRQSALQPVVATRDRILDAAIQRFSRHPYGETGLRDIAADVGVDVAYVHRCFGSKERLFAEAVKSTVRPERLLADATADPAGKLAKQLFARDAESARGEVGPLDIIIRSLASSEASRVVREFILDDFIEPLAGMLDRPEKHRAALIAGFLLGVGILRNVLRIEPLPEAEGGQVETLVAQAINGIMGRASHHRARGAPSRGTIASKARKASR